MSYDHHLAFLESIHPDRGSSSIRQTPLSLSSHRQADLDIIVPAYNVEDYIDDCLKSLIKQKTQYTYRVIVVDDGATDHTPALIDAYQKIENFVIVHQENQGLSGARNTGLERLDAKYVMFVDSDDCLPSRAIEVMMQAAFQYDADIVAGSYCNFRRFVRLHKSYYQKAGAGLSPLALTGHACGKIYRSELFMQVQFPRNYWFEDSIVSQLIFPQAQMIVGIKDIVYNRRVNRQSITQTSAGNPKSLDSLWVTLRLLKDRQLFNMPFTQNDYEYLLNQVVLTVKRVSQLGEEVRKSTFFVFAQVLNEQFDTYMTEYADKQKLEQAIRNEDYEAFVRCIN